MLFSKKSSPLSSSICLALFRSVARADGGYQVKTIVVTASKHETSTQLAPASISVIDRKELKLRNADDLAGALTGQAGVNVTSVGQSRQGISMRRMPVEHTLYLVDGLNDCFTFYSGVENIFDEQLEDESDLYNGTEPGRTFRLGVTASF